MNRWATANAGSWASAGLWPPTPDLLGPDPARDVDQDAAAVALAVDVPGAMEHLLEVRERELDRRPAGGRVLAYRRVDRTGVAILDAGRRNTWAIGSLGRKATPLGTPGDERSDGRPCSPPGIHAFFERARDWGTRMERKYTLAHGHIVRADVGSDRGSLAEGRHREDHAGALADRRLRRLGLDVLGDRRRPAGKPLRLLRHRPDRRADARRRPPGPGAGRRRRPRASDPGQPPPRRGRAHARRARSAAR